MDSLKYDIEVRRDDNDTINYRIKWLNDGFIIDKYNHQNYYAYSSINRFEIEHYIQFSKHYGYYVLLYTNNKTSRNSAIYLCIFQNNDSPTSKESLQKQHKIATEFKNMIEEKWISYLENDRFSLLQNQLKIIEEKLDALFYAPNQLGYEETKKHFIKLTEINDL